MSKARPKPRGGRGRGLLFVVSGPSGSGKTTLVRSLLAGRGLEGFAKSISVTTRPKRTGEKSGRDYFFISEADFRRRLQAKKILEWTKYLGYYYATPRDFVERNLNRGRHMLLCLDLRGALKIQRLYPHNAVTIFVMPPSVEALRERIARRCRTTGAAEIRARLKLARQELRSRDAYDYFVMNKDLPRAVRQLRKIIAGEIGHSVA